MATREPGDARMNRSPDRAAVGPATMEAVRLLLERRRMQDGGGRRW